MLVGREHALAAGEAAITAAVGGRGGLVLIAGEAGIGKTTLARALVERGRAAGALTRWGACWEGASLLPFGPWIDGLRRPGGDACAAAAERLESGQLDAGPDAPDGEGRRLRFFGEVVDALRDVSASQPQVLVLEDVHWADTGSLLLLRAVASHLPTMPVLLVATYREDEMDPEGPLASVGGGAERLALEGLLEDDVGRLLAHVLGRPPTADEVRAVHRQTAGNPLFVTQVGRLVAAGSATKVPAGTRDVLARRLARLSPASDRVLGAAAVIGTDFDLDTLVAVADDANDDVMAALDEVAAAGLVTPVEGSPDRWAFVHALVRSARYDALGSAERRRWHRRVLDVLDGQPAVSVGVLAHHAARADFEPQEARPAGLAADAAREALARLAWDEAAALAERALAAAPLGPAGADVRVEALLALGGARLRTGDEDGAAEAFTAAAAIGRDQGRPEVIGRAALGFAAGLGGFEVRRRDPRQLELLEEAMAGLSADASLRPLVLARLSVALPLGADDERRLGLADEAIALARRNGDERALAAALGARCDAVAGPDHVTERLRDASEIVALAQRSGDLSLELLGRRQRVVAVLELRDLAGFDTEVTMYASASDRIGDPLYGWYVPIWRAMAAYADGRTAEAGELVEEARAIGARADSRNAEMLTTTFAFFAALDRRDVAVADAEWARMISRHPEMQGMVTAGLTALVDAHCGRADRARATLATCGLRELERLPRDQEWVTAVCQFIDAAATCGVDAVVRRAYELLLPYEGFGAFEGLAAFDHGVTDRFLALAAGHLGDAPAAVRHTDRTLERVTGAGRLVIAHTRAYCARGLFAIGDDAGRARAAELARAAVADYEAFGFGALASELRAVADGSGAIVASVPPRPVAQTPSLVREGDTWAWTFDGTTVRVRHGKGIADLAALLASAGRDVHVRELAGGPSGPPGSAQSILDDRAVAQYRQRLADLEEDLDEADRHGDAGRAETLAAERDRLVEELTKAFGLGGRARRLGSDPDERLRKAVSARVRTSIDRLEALHPALGRHLRVSVRTGFWCSYQPENEVVWKVADPRHA